MKKLLKALVLTMFCITISSIGVQAYAYYPLEYINADPVSPQSDIIEWRYKVENGKLYKRQYNCTQDKWIGDWILVS